MSKPTITVDVRTSVLVFRNSTPARRVVDAASVFAVRACVVDAVKKYLRAGGSVDLGPAGPVTAAVLTTRSAPVRVGEHARAFELSFPEELIGGFDNDNSGDVVVAQRGPAVAAAIMVSSRQAERRVAERALARRLAGAALARATNRLG